MIGCNKFEIVLIVDSPEFISTFNGINSLKKYQFTSFTDGSQALDYLLKESNNLRVVILSNGLPSINRFEIIKMTREAGFRYKYLFISPVHSTPNAIKTIQLENADYVEINNLEDELPVIIENKFDELCSSANPSYYDALGMGRDRLERILQVRLKISAFAPTHTLNEIIQTIIDEAELLTQSSIGFFHFLDKDQKALTLQTWSTNTLTKMCTAEGKGRHYPIEQAGVWVDCIRLRKPIIHNDYNSLPHRKGLPDGHTKVIRELVIPIIEGDTIVAILGVGNKELDYNETDLNTVNQLSNFAWDIIKSKKAEEALKENEERYRFMFENNPQPMFIYDLETLAFLQVNKAIVEQFGYSKEEFLSMSLKDIHRPEDIENLMLDIEKTRCSDNPNGEWVNVKKNGELIYTEIVAQSVIFNNRTARHIITSNITKRKQIEISLMESEERYRSLFDNTTIGLYRTTPEGQILMANPTIISLLGYSSFEELAKRNLEIEGIEPDYTREQFRQRLEKEGTIRGLESVWTRIDGTKVFIRESAKVIYGNNKEILYYEGTIEDISERKQAEDRLIESANQWQITFDTVKDGVCLLDSHQQIIRCNKVMAELFPIMGNNMIGKKCWEVVHSRNEQFDECPIVKMKKTLQRESIEIKLGSKWFDVTVDPIFDENNSCTGAVHIVRDITERKSAEESLTLLNNQLKAINATKDKLFSIVAHDLKSPFNSILGFSDLLMNNLHSYNHKRIEECIEQINSSAKSTLALIDNLLVWANSQMGRIYYKPENLRLLTTIQEILNLLSSSARIKNITIRYFEADDINVYADKNMLQIIIRNLISNAIKFTKPDGKINIYSTMDQNHVEITISDNGIGMSKEICNKLFDPNDNITTDGTANEKGSGLGLMLCKEFIDKHGGKIWAESELDIGSEFKFTLPKSKLT